MDINVIPNCITLFWVAGKMTRMQPAKAPAAAYMGRFGLFHSCCLQQPLSQISQTLALGVGKGWPEYPIAGKCHEAGNGLANISVQGGVPVTVSPAQLDLLGACLQAAIEAGTVKSLSSVHLTKMSPEDVGSIQGMWPISFVCRAAALCSGREFLMGWDHPV